MKLRNRRRGAAWGRRKRPGQDLVLRLAALATLLTPLAGGRAAAGEDTPRPGRPNILWLIAEDFGPHLGCYGAKEVSTPNLDRLAAEGVRYTRFFTTAPVCSASRSAFMTGMYQTTIGAHNHRSHRDDGYRLPHGVRLLTDWLRDAGYFTANVRELPARAGFRGSGKTDWNFTYENPARGDRPFDSDRWDDLKAHQPFFAQVNFQETHRAFRAPRRADPAKVEIPPYYPDHPVTRTDWAAYLDAAAELDRKVGLVLDQLEADGLADRTVVVFFGDNGQAHVRGKQFCYESGLRVPLVIHWPKGFPAPAGFEPGTPDGRLIAAIDLAPTMLDIARAAKPAKMQGEVFLGERAAPPRRHVFGARDRCDETVFRFRTVRDARYRYIRNFTPERPFLQPNEYKAKQYPVWNLLQELHAAGKLTPVQDRLCAPSMPAEELYDLEADPHEVEDLATSPRHQDVLRRLRAELEQWIEESGDQGRELEPADLAAQKGVTRPGTHPNTGYTLDGKPPEGALAAHLVSRIDVKDFGAETARIGDLSGDGAPDLLFVQSVYGTREITCLTATTIHGEVLWQSGKPSAANGRIYSDLPVQIYDWDDDGRNEVLHVRQAKYAEPPHDGKSPRERASRYEGDAAMIVLDAASGKELRAFPLPAPADDAFLFADLSGRGRREDLVVKDRYWNLWGIARDGRVLWRYTGSVGHFPAIADVDGDGRDEVFCGFALIDHDGKVLFEQDAKGAHQDATWIVRPGDGKWRLFFGNSGIHCLAATGAEIWSHPLGEAQHVVAGRFRPESELQLMVVDRTPVPTHKRDENAWAILYLYDLEGKELWHRQQPKGAWAIATVPLDWSGDPSRRHALVYGRGPGRPAVLYDGAGEIAVTLPMVHTPQRAEEDRRADFYGLAADVWGDGRDEVILFGSRGACIYTNPRPLQVPTLYNETLYPGM